MDLQILKVGMDTQTVTLDKTWKEIYDAFSLGWPCNIVVTPEPGVDAVQSWPIHAVFRSATGYEISTMMGDGTTKNFATDSETGYPVQTTDDGSGDGSGGSTLIVTQVASTDLLDKTFAEIKDAFLSGSSVILSSQRVESDPDYGYTNNSYMPLVDIEEKVYTNPESTNFYHVYFGPSGYSVYEANSPDDYPSVAEI